MIFVLNMDFATSSEHIQCLEFSLSDFDSTLLDMYIGSVNLGLVWQIPTTAYGNQLISIESFNIYGQLPGDLVL